MLAANVLSYEMQENEGLEAWLRMPESCKGLTFCFRRLQLSHALAVRCLLSGSTLGRVIFRRASASSLVDYLMGMRVGVGWFVRTREWMVHLI